MIEKSKYICTTVYLHYTDIQIILTGAPEISSHHHHGHAKIVKIKMNTFYQNCIQETQFKANVLKFQTLYSILFWPNFFFILCHSFMKYLVEWQTV